LEQENGNALDAKNAVQEGSGLEGNALFEAEDVHVPGATMA